MSGRGVGSEACWTLIVKIPGMLGEGQQSRDWSKSVRPQHSQASGAFRDGAHTP